MGAEHWTLKIAGGAEPLPPKGAPGKLAPPLVRDAPIGLMIDVPDVLYDASLWRRWLWRLVSRLNVQANCADFFAGWDREYLADVYCGRREHAEAFQSFLLSAGLTWAQVDEVEAACRIERRDFELNVRPLPGVVSTIDALHRAQVPLLAWGDTPSPAARLAECLDRLHLSNRFATVLTSFDLEAALPSPVCYQQAAENLGMVTDSVVYVGHDAEHLAGAKAAGLRTVAFNYGAHATADFYLARFEDLLGLIQTRSLRAARPAAKPDLLQAA